MRFADRRQVSMVDHSCPGMAFLDAHSHQKAIRRVIVTTAVTYSRHGIDPSLLL